MNFNSLCIVYIVALLCTISTGQLRNVPNQQSNYVNNEIGIGSEKFALELFKIISDTLDNEPYNFLISPFSVWSLLVLLTEAASGESLEQLKRTLQIESNPALLRQGYKEVQKYLSINTPTLDVSVFQAMFVSAEANINPEYERVVKQDYQAQLQRINFLRPAQAADTINNYVNKATKGTIDTVVFSEDLIDVKMIMLSTLYFKGQWKIPFNLSLTRPEPFYDENGKVLGEVNMMYQKGLYPYAAIKELDAHVIEIPYGNENRLSMIIFLPRKGGVNLRNVVQNLFSLGMKKVFNELNAGMQQFEDEDLELYLPRFTTTADFALNVVLEQMGVKDIFNARKANLTNMSSDEIYLTRMFHKTKIEVNEEGTVASAATVGVFANKASPTRFYVNRPFAYVIIEKTTNSILFCGQVRDPTKG